MPVECDRCKNNYAVTKPKYTYINTETLYLCGSCKKMLKRFLNMGCV